MSEYTEDRDRLCPECCLQEMEYREISPSRLTYHENGEEITLLFGTSRDYCCKNCGCAFILLMEEAP